MNRLLALALALIIGSPNCWCCMKPAAAPARHDCCMIQEGKDCPLGKDSSKKGRPDKDCACDLSKTKREMSSAPVTLPPATFVIAAPVETDLAVYFSSRLPATHWLIDDGPPHDRLSIFARNRVLRL